MNPPIKLTGTYDNKADVILYQGDTRSLLKNIPNNSVQLIITSPPYNIGKEYEERKTLDKYLEEQKEIIDLCVPLVTNNGSICWQVGNYITRKGEVVPLDILLYDLFKNHNLLLRNRIVWHFGHGLHTKHKFSGRYEVILWFTRDTKEYTFNLDSVRVPQKYPGKTAFKGPNIGEYSGHPDGKNPSDAWDTMSYELHGDFWKIPNVKSKHVEKTDHPCQFPIALVQRLIRALSDKGDWVLDPFMGVGSTACAAIIEERKPIGAEINKKYVKISKKRIIDAWNGELKYRPFDKQIYEPKQGTKLTQRKL